MIHVRCGKKQGIIPPIPGWGRFYVGKENRGGDRALYLVCRLCKTECIHFLLLDLPARFRADLFTEEKMVAALARFVTGVGTRRGPVCSPQRRPLFTAEAGPFIPALNCESELS